MKHNLKVGQKVWVTTRLRNNYESDPVQDEISKIGNKFFYLKSNRSKFWIDTLDEENDFNTTYFIYLDKQEILDKIELSELSREIRKMIGTFGDLPLSLEKVRNIYEIIKSSPNE
jgi:hypothetical protein